METSYIVKFMYYQYNTGRADNGTKPCTINFNSLNEAIEAKSKINKVFNKDGNFDDLLWVEELFDEHAMLAGHIASTAEIFKKELQITKIQ